MTNYRWTICAMLFFATTVNYLDRQVLSLTWDEFIKPEFHWDESHYGTITSVFSIVYAICMLFAGRFVDWMGTKKGFLWAIGVWSAGACLHAVCGIVTEAQVGLHSAAELAGATGDVVVTIATVSMYCFYLQCRCIYRSIDRSSYHSYSGKNVRLGNGIYRNWWTWLYLDGILGVYV